MNTLYLVVNMSVLWNRKQALSISKLIKHLVSWLRLALKWKAIFLLFLVLQVMILITDGRQSRDPGYLSLNEAIKPLRAQNITILAVGIGGSVDERELRVLTGNTENVFLVQSFGELPSLERRLVSRSCQAWENVSKTIEAGEVKWPAKLSRKKRW